MRSRVFFLASLIYALVLAALLTRSSGLALLALPMLCYLAIAAYQAPDQPRLRAERVLSRQRVSSGEPVEMMVTVTNQGDSPLRLRLADTLAPGMQVLDGQPALQVALPPGEAATLRYRLQARRGSYAWKNLQAVISDPLGVLETRLELPAAAGLQVQPRWSKLPHLALRPRQTLHSAGPIPARRAGAGTDFWGVREYRVGDSLRWLNWRSTARHPRQLFTTEFEREEIADIGLIVDARQQVDIPNGDESLFEHSIRAAASLAELFLREGNRVGLLIFGESLASLFPGYGKVQLNHILARLSAATTGSNVSMESLKYIPMRLFPSRTQIIFISPLGPDDLPAFRRLKASGYSVLLLSPDPVDYAARALPPSGRDDLAVRLARLERHVQLKGLLRKGVGVVDWQVSEPLGRAVQASLYYSQVARERVQ